jgi:hypothetical protein
MTGIEHRAGSGTLASEDVQCPDCSEVSWVRDGLWIHRRPNGSLDRQWLSAAQDRDMPWACSACGATVFSWMQLHVRLEQAATDAGGA